jgi:glycine cleavage system aminomethyltransferase T
MCPVRAVRVAYTGELGWELHHPIEMQNYLFDLLGPAGETHGLKLVGARAQNWLRQEKSYRAFGTELGRDATPLEAGLDRFVDLSKDFQGKEAMVATGIRSKCVTLLIDGPADADPWGREALYHEGQKGRAVSPRAAGRCPSASRSAWAMSPRPVRGRLPAEASHAARTVGGRGCGGQSARSHECAHSRRWLGQEPAVKGCEALLHRP